MRVSAFKTHVRIPYVQRVGVGLHIGPREVRWVELVRSFAGLPPGLPFERLRLRRYEAEPVVGGQQEAALRRLVERIQPRYRYVHAHVDPGQVRVRFLDAPAFDDDEDLNAWLAEQPARLLPAGSDAAAFVTRTAVVSRREEGARCLVALVRREAVEERAAMVERVGLVPLRVGTGLVEMSSAFVFEPEFESEEPVVVLVDGHGVVAVPTRGGVPDGVAVLSGRVSSGLVGEVEAQLGIRTAGGGGREVWATGDEASDAGLPEEKAVCSVHPLSSALDGGKDLPAEAVLAASLAAEGLYPPLALVDLQDGMRSGEARYEEAKGEAYGALLGMGLAVFALLLLLHGAVWTLQRNVEDAGLRLMAQAETLAALSAERRVVEQRRRDLAASRQLVVERTEAARVMEVVGRAVPGDVALNGLRIDAGEEGRREVRLAGWSTSPSGVGDLVARLEGGERLGRVRLQRSERLGADQAERLMGTDRPLTLFEVFAGVEKAEFRWGGVEG